MSSLRITTKLVACFKEDVDWFWAHRCTQENPMPRMKTKEPQKTDRTHGGSAKYIVLKISGFMKTKQKSNRVLESALG
jgi:hypothetical protein